MAYTASEVNDFLTETITQEMLRSLEPEDVAAFLEQIGGDFSGYQKAEKLGRYLFEYFAHGGYPRVEYLTDRVHQSIFERFLNSVVSEIDWTGVAESVLAHFEQGD